MNSGGKSGEVKTFFESINCQTENEAYIKTDFPGINLFAGLPE